MKKIEREKMNKEDKYSNRTSLPKDGMILAENDDILLRAVSEGQKDYMFRVSYECSFCKHEFENDTYRKYLWEEFISENVANYCIYINDTKDFIGYCGIKDLTREIPELAIELLSKYRNHGYGFQALSLLMDQFSVITGEKIFRTRVEVDNYASQSLHRKLGAVPNGLSEFLLHGEDLIRYQNENQYLIDDNIRKLAVDFEVDPIEILGHVLEYKIEWK